MMLIGVRYVVRGGLRFIPMVDFSIIGDFFIFMSSFNIAYMLIDDRPRANHEVWMTRRSRGKFLPCPSGAPALSDAFCALCLPAQLQINPSYMDIKR